MNKKKRKAIEASSSLNILRLKFVTLEITVINVEYIDTPNNETSQKIKIILAKITSLNRFENIDRNVIRADMKSRPNKQKKIVLTILLFITQFQVSLTLIPNPIHTEERIRRRAQRRTIDPKKPNISKKSRKKIRILLKNNRFLFIYILD